MNHGTGVFKGWYDNGILAHETTIVGGLPTGRQKCWDEKGDLVAEAYWIDGKRVSRKKYFERCKVEPWLPQYAETRSRTS
jgi:antitoxin component YwqK of YwqJK toxin-antitoxin module